MVDEQTFLNLYVCNHTHSMIYHIVLCKYIKYVNHFYFTYVETSKRVVGKVIKEVFTDVCKENW